MSAINMTCPKCGAKYIAGMVGSTPWPPHVCAKKRAASESDPRPDPRAIHLREFTDWPQSTVPVRTYLGVPVIVVMDHGDGWVTARWPDYERPKKAHGAPGPFTYERGEWWKMWSDQLRPGVALIKPPVAALAPKAVGDPSEGIWADPWVTVRDYFADPPTCATAPPLQGEPPENGSGGAA